jgi:hypothetical protein
MALIRFANDTVRVINLPNPLTPAKMESIGDNSMSDREEIFDTTLGDGEQSPAIRDKLHHFF